MKYKITLKGKTYEVEVERGEAMLLDEYDAVAPIPTAAPAPVSRLRAKARVLLRFPPGWNPGPGRIWRQIPV